MRNRQFALVLALATIAALAGCEAQEAEETGGPVEGQAEAAPAQSTAAGAAAVEAVEGGLALAPIDHSGVTGTVEADRDDDEVTLSLSLQGLQSGTAYSAHVHQGRCAAGGPVLVPFDTVEVGEGGAGSARLETDTVGIPADAEVFVQVHGQDGAAVACADLDGDSDGDGDEADGG